MNEDAYLAKINAQMSVNQFVVGPTAEDFWRQLIARIDNLRRPDDTFELMPSNAAGAWNAAWAVYIKLRDRDRIPHSQEQINKALRHKAFEEQWNEYISELPRFVTLVQRERLSQEMLAYLGLKPNDLDDPTFGGDPRFDGRRPDWREISARIRGARYRFEHMSEPEKLNVPTVTALRRTEAALREIQAKYSALEQRIAAVESKYIEATAAKAA